MPRLCAFAAVLGTTLLVVGCGKTVPEPLPEVARQDGVTLVANPDPLVIRPNGSGRIRFQAVDEAQRPLAYYPVDFSIESGPGQETAGARLSTPRSLTDLAGETVVEVIVGPLANNDRPAAFWVSAACPGAAPRQATILVTTNAYSVEIVPVSGQDLLAPAQLVATKLYFFDSAACKNLDIYEIESSLAQARTPQSVPVNASFLFQGVAATGVHAVVGIGLDSAQTRLMGGCVDIPGPALLEAETMRATLVLDHAFPALSGRFAVSSDFALDPAPKAVSLIRSAWQEWQRCLYDPARLWLDCTLAALGSDPGSCVPPAFTANSLGDLIAGRRGAPQAAPTTSAGETPCRGPVDGAGNPSLEVAIDALFANTRLQLSAAGLGALSSELATLLADVRLSSRLSLAQATDPNSYWAEHELEVVTFSGVVGQPIVLAVDQPTQGAILAVPVPMASGILATFQAGRLFLPDHGFTLRLGTAARYAFEAASLDRARNAKDTDAFVTAVFSLAQLPDQRNALGGCAAFDAMVCDQVNQARGCIVDACRAGLAALGRKLAQSFDSLDGIGLDLRLSGWAPVIDLDGDGHADALGSTDTSGGLPVGSGLWYALIETQAGTHGAPGSWLATRDPTSR